MTTPTALTLHALPTLLTDCVLVGHAHKADVVFTPPQWFAMCAHMMNENPDNFFLMPYFDEKYGQDSLRRTKSAQPSASNGHGTISEKPKLPPVGFIRLTVTNNRDGALLTLTATMRTKTVPGPSHTKRLPRLFVNRSYTSRLHQRRRPGSGWHLFIHQGLPPGRRMDSPAKQVAVRSKPQPVRRCESFLISATALVTALERRAHGIQRTGVRPNPA
jgi:hypothetical protein